MQKQIVATYRHKTNLMRAQRMQHEREEKEAERTFDRLQHELNDLMADQLRQQTALDVQELGAAIGSPE